ncbi:DUF397 domain-containing protein [Streptomyces sp. P38-E01]|uniref:DUF397 domain-containing protein n=1 Tax=Streptomyces tardus TaxID=2780544 RepID=A0A949JC47_9ACTN|nr:DUF397 domain-containing protein [Streptomyces tardus]MBU7596293.1 DUF397 domain-containing protein [Streptomyces tardus]
MSVSWRKSSYSNQDGGDCLEVADGFAGVVPVRDSKVPSGPALVLAHDDWTTFLTALKSGSLSG